jgi:predicted MFS family arabinose efflux permease
LCAQEPDNYDSAATDNRDRPSYAVFLNNPSVVLAGIGLCVSAGFSVLLPVVPILLERDGPHGAGGAGTAALFAGAVVGELLSLWLMSSFSSKLLVTAGMTLMAALSPVFVLPHAPGWLLLAAQSLRGTGTGLAVVVCSVLVADLGPPHRRGRSIGIFGFSLSAPGILLPSVGVTLVGAGRVDAVAITAVVAGLLGAGLALRLPPHKAPRVNTAANLLVAAREPGLMAVLASFILVSLSFGSVLTFAPLVLPSEGAGSAAVFLLLAGVTRAASRWLAGVLSDSKPARLVLTGAMFVTCVGLVALALHSNPVVTLLAAVAFGAGFGAVQTSAYLAMMERSGAASRVTVSALWNTGVDLGSSLGGAVLGVTAAQVGYPKAFWIAPAVVVVSLPLAFWSGHLAMRPAVAVDAHGSNPSAPL